MAHRVAVIRRGGFRVGPMGASVERNHAPLVAGVVSIEKDGLFGREHDLVRRSDARDAWGNAMQGRIFLHLVVVEGFHLADKLGLVLRLGIVERLVVQSGRFRTERAPYDVTLADLLDRPDSEEVVPDAVEIGVPVGHAGRRLGGGAGVLSSFSAIVRLCPEAYWRGQNDR